MTFWAGKKPGNPQMAEVHVTSGPISIVVDEAPGHLRHFWGELGRLLEEMEKRPSISPVPAPGTPDNPARLGS